MALVDYSTSASNSEDEHEPEPTSEPPAKRLKAEPQLHPDPGIGESGSAVDSSGLPPLPPAFHDLYASTVRRSVLDDPTLHQGRKRQIPHAVGNWPSHLYIEWHPTKPQHDLLIKLVRRVDEALRHDLHLHDFLTSDLGAPLPLHISLSRPMALSTPTKDRYLDRIASAIRGCRTDVFRVTPRDLTWYHSPDSNRVFLILRVASTQAGEGRLLNPELAALLAACNDIAVQFDQPALYQQNNGEAESPVDDAFHISIGWTFGLRVDGPALEALEPFRSEPFREMQAWEIEISGVKAKIGNVVNHIPLGRGPSGHESTPHSSKSLFGL